MIIVTPDGEAILDNDPTLFGPQIDGHAWSQVSDDTHDWPHSDESKKERLAVDVDYEEKAGWPWVVKIAAAVTAVGIAVLATSLWFSTHGNGEPVADPPASSTAAPTELPEPTFVMPDDSAIPAADQITDDGRYLHQLHQDGVKWTDPTAVITDAHRICSYMDAHPTSIADMITGAEARSPGEQPKVVRSVVLSAVEAYCPRDNDH